MLKRFYSTYAQMFVLSCVKGIFKTIQNNNNHEYILSQHTSQPIIECFLLYVTGTLRDMTGSYDIVFAACSAASLLGCVLIGISQCIRKSKQKARQRKQSIYVSS